jgi:hypothetical protein
MPYTLKTVYLRYRDEFNPVQWHQGIFSNVITIDVQFVWRTGTACPAHFPHEGGPCRNCGEGFIPTVTLDTLHGIRVFEASELRCEVQIARVSDR